MLCKFWISQTYVGHFESFGFSEIILKFLKFWICIKFLTALRSLPGLAARPHGKGKGKSTEKERGQGKENEKEKGKAKGKGKSQRKKERVHFQKHIDALLCLTFV